MHFLLNKNLLIIVIAIGDGKQIVKQTKSKNPEYKNQEGEWVNARFTSEM